MVPIDFRSGHRQDETGRRPRTDYPSCPDAAATRRWAERFERFVGGHHTVVAFCAAEGVSATNFYLWRWVNLHGATRRAGQTPLHAQQTGDVARRTVHFVTPARLLLLLD